MLLLVCLVSINRLSLLLCLWVTSNAATVFRVGMFLGRTDLTTASERGMAGVALLGCSRVSLGRGHFGDSFGCHSVILL